jgi:hypothetical protein
MKPKAIFLFFCTIFVESQIFCQISGEKPPQLLLFSFNIKSVKNVLSLDHSADFVQPERSYLPADFSATALGFFCKQEIKLEKITKFPFRFRLGSVGECDRMEGKINCK